MTYTILYPSVTGLLTRLIASLSFCYYFFLLIRVFLSRYQALRKVNAKAYAILKTDYGNLNLEVCHSLHTCAYTYYHVIHLFLFIALSGSPTTHQSTNQTYLSYDVHSIPICSCMLTSRLKPVTILFFLPRKGMFTH